MKEKIIITGSKEDLKRLENNPNTKDYKIISVNQADELNEGQINNIKENDNVDELIMLLSTDQQQMTFFHKYKDLFPEKRFGFVHFL